MDVLGDILRIIRLSGSVYFNEAFCAPWGIAIEKNTRSAFHIVLEGEAWLQTASLPAPLKLSAGDILLFLKGARHSISDTPGSECYSGQQVIDAYQNNQPLFDGDDKTFKIVCGYVEFDNSLLHPFLSHLPEFIHINADLKARFYWLDCIIQQVALESEIKRPGSDLLVDKFTEILFIQAIRTYIESKSEEENYLSALMDTQLSKALALIHAQPEKDWSINQLANHIGMSRSAFYVRFNEYIGMPPSTYLYEWRMLLAKQKIESTKKAMALIAEEVGYQSDSAFQKAFKRFFKFTPASLRKKTPEAG